MQRSYAECARHLTRLVRAVSIFVRTLIQHSRPVQGEQEGFVITRQQIFELLFLIFFATIHGYGAAWLAVRMLFRPHTPKKFLGMTIWPQGMIPRHRARLAQTIGNAVGNELVSHDTVVDALFETDFFQRKVSDLVDTYTRDLLDKPRSSFIDALPAGVRGPVLDAISALQLRVAEYIADILKSEETAAAINSFIDRRVDELLSRRLTEVVTDDLYAQTLGFVEERFRLVTNERGFEAKVRDFVSARIDELAHSRATLAEVFTPETVAIVMERIDAQLAPIVSHLSEIATNRRTRQQIGALIKREVDDYYQQLNFFKKIFLSRERIHSEVDEMVNKTLPRRVEEFLRGDAFAREAEAFLNSTIDNFLARPLDELVGSVSPDKLELIKDQIAVRILAIARGDELLKTVSAYSHDALARLRPHTIRALIEHASPDSAQRLKSFLSKSLFDVLAREETARTINNILTAQIDRLLVAPIGRIGDHLPAATVERASRALVERVVSAAREKLPQAIREFDIGGIVREKVSSYPVKKLEDLVLSVAKDHLRKIELFGAAIGFFLGLSQAAYFALKYTGTLSRLWARF
ncbi:MAG: hypothetical protein QOE33_3143 [Acidobacteriota bacterium]|nr:hypothetical protein [Acidobacteriota bacterium]